MPRKRKKGCVKINNVCKMSEADSDAKKENEEEGTDGN